MSKGCEAIPSFAVTRGVPMDAPGFARVKFTSTARSLPIADRLFAFARSKCSPSGNIDSLRHEAT